MCQAGRMSLGVRPSQFRLGHLGTHIGIARRPVLGQDASAPDMSAFSRLGPFVATFIRRLPAGADPALEEDRARNIRARQIQAVLRLTLSAMVANIVNATLVCWAFWDSTSKSWLLAWTAAVVFLAARGIMAWLRGRRRPEIAAASSRAIKRAELHATALAAVWALAPMALFAQAEAPQQLLLATLITGMVCAGGFALATVPTAATAYVIVMGLGAAVSIVRSAGPMSGAVGALLITYCATVISVVWSTASLFTARLLAEAEAARQGEVIGLLLRDFEESASDVLWESDREGRLRGVSARLSEVFGLPDLALVAAPLTELIERATPTSGEIDDAPLRLQTLRERLAGATPFRDVIVASVRDGHTRWWSFSAKPHLDRTGTHVGWRGVISDITDAYTADQRLQWLAHNDSLTGLSNRHQFRTRLAHLLSVPQEPGHSVAVIYADLDHFKSINDTFGHAVGDAVLKVMAERMLSTLHPGELVARLGGDEFAVLMPGVSRVDEVEQLCRRLLLAVTEPCEVGGLRYRVRCSMGIALAPQDGDEVDALLSHADLALYAAKSAGRNEIRFFAPAMASNTRRRLAIEEGLREAAARGQFRLVFQAKISLTSRQPLSFEALLRWRHPALGDVSPSEFIAIAEESGQIGPIGRWVLETACREAQTWPAALTLAVNVSPVQAVSQELVSDVQGALSATGLTADRLELEITESALLSQTSSSARVMHQLRALGCRIALDDFGTGYSALSYLRQFPFNALKIDRSLITGLAARSDAQAIVRMIIGLARTLQLETVAEGVDDPSQLDALTRYGCDSAQGYLICEPMAADAIPQFLQTLALHPRSDAVPLANQES